jgi:hypothetical protein
MNHRQQKDSKNGGVSATGHSVQLSVTIIVWILRKSISILEYLLVIAKYQFYIKTAVAPSAIRLPWNRLLVIGLLAFIAFRKEGDMKTNSPRAVHFGATPFVGEPSYLPEEARERPIAKLASLFESEDPYADASNDDESTRKVKAYIRRFRHVAEAEREKFGIPASVKMAQAILESNAGKSKLSRENRNHFGIKCFSRSCKKGHCSNFGDDSHKDFFRKYETNWESWRAHSLLITTGKYRSLLKHGDDYEKWARGLKKLGYATAGNYDDSLITTIEKYKLQLLDN